MSIVSEGDRNREDRPVEASPYAGAWREWDERYADLAIGKRNWQLAAGGLLIMGMILAGGIVWQSGRSKYIPYVVEVDRLGYGLTVPQPLTAVSVADGTVRMERYEVATFIRQAREVSSDPQVERQMLIPCWRMHAARQIDSWTSTTTPTPRITLSRLRKSKPYPYKSIRSFSCRRKAIRCDGPSRRAI